MGFWDKLKKYISSDSNNNIIKESHDKNDFEEKVEISEKIIKSSSFAYEIDYNNYETIEKIKEEFIAFDVETTGLSALNDEIIEIGAVRFKNGYITERFSTLINPKIPIPIEATKVNHITNEMVKNAPTSNEIILKFVEFFGDALQSSGTIIIAHNANFDMGFLTEFLKKNYRENTSIRYADTLKLSRKTLSGLVDYKLNTVANHFEIHNLNAHRAVSDAETCGNVLLKLLPLKQEENIKIKAKRESKRLDETEAIIATYIQNIIMSENDDIEFWGFDKNTNGYITINYLYTFLKYKLTKNGIYIIVKKEDAEKTGLQTEICSINEGGTENLRVYISEIFDIDLIKEYILKIYKKCMKDAKGYINNSKYAREKAYEVLNGMNTYTDSELKSCMEKIKNEKIVFPSINIKNTVISREQITINPINTRIDISNIKECKEYWSKEFEKGLDLWIKGEELRKDGKYEEAIDVYNQSRETGYCSSPLYESYSMVYHKIKDYDNEIAILEEGISRLKKEKANISNLETRLNKAITSKYNLIEKERAKIESEKIKEEKRLFNLEQKRIEKEKRKIEKENTIIEGRHIIQMDDDGNIINEFVSIAEAVRQTGINSKSIRDTAKGVQKHAGGFCWQYKD